ncbi:MAG TPA: trypsin-like peptidase domain-containing protein [Leptospiraceae bacterium]|nr:trypsin-like peptidase domain-containing protein [Leptospiraceae bacterium]HMW03444.1 trypsin-like peptidase domain-containing protein [Leptospiraceae bacterium]HMX31577.1 trypsin-like peptidase domain-containing protein [Leptospiraceae bacterium]HMY29636.1 trypsin-like peptidase domain-containing protein [Leptospiraceae bacterium]HMZ66182.1 trypsin-like peptidase domain-containing protein [Leptospiraceae bacterium]
MNKKNRKFIIPISILFIGTLLSPLFYCLDANKSSLALNAKTEVNPSPALSQAIGMQSAFNEVFEHTADSVVSIATEKTVNIQMNPFMDPFSGEPFFFGPRGKGKTQKQKQNGLGSGIILNKEGYVLTNEHVIHETDKLHVKLRNKKSYEAEIIGSDPVSDIALLRIKGAKDLSPIDLGDSSKVKVGDWAIAIGAPLGYEHSFTVGVVSGIARGGIDSSGVSYIQTDAAINQGNSGGPLLDIYGRVIGINRMIVSPSGGSIGIGFAIPINEAKRIVEELKTNGKIKRPWVGIALDAIDDETKDELKLSSTEGALIKQIYGDSPAAEAGLELQDVITKINDEKMKSPEDVVNFVRKSKIGDKLSFTILRKGKEVKIMVKIKERTQ